MYFIYNRIMQKAILKNKIRTKITTWNVVFEREDDGGYSVYVPALTGCFSQGDTFEEAIENIKEAISLYIDKEGKEKIKPLAYRAEREFIIPLKIGEYA